LLIVDFGLEEQEEAIQSLRQSSIINHQSIHAVQRSGVSGQQAGPPVRTGGPWDPGENPLNSGKNVWLAGEPNLNFEF
jgi:hypothetical protein